MKPFTAVFLADSQLGMYSTFSGMTDEQIEQYARSGMRVWKVPRYEGHEWDAERYERAVEAVNALKPDLVLFGGDMVDLPDSEAQLDDFFRISASIDGDIPVRWVPGNHDIAPDTIAPTPESLVSYRDVFGDDYYVFDEGPVRFVMINTVVIDHPEMVPEEWAAQRGFIEEALAPDPDAPTRVVIGHHPFFLESPDEDDTYWNLPKERRAPILDLMSAAKVPLALAGHWHRNNIATSGELEMVTSGPVGYPLGDDPSGFRILEFDDAGVRHRYLPLPT